MPFTPALVSITFRQLSCERVIAAARAAGLHAIEWGGDVHCPGGDAARAATVARLTREAGLAVCAYGSYHRLGADSGSGPAFADVLSSAIALGAPRIRVWAGAAGSAETSSAQRARIVDDARRCADLAGAHGIRVLSEWHGGTLTDTAESGRRFLAEVAHPSFATVWQPSVGLDADAALAEFDAVAPWIEHLHVFHWRGHERRPLAEGADRWRRYLARAAALDRPLAAALEFVRDDDPAQLGADGATLAALLAGTP